MFTTILRVTVLSATLAAPLALRAVSWRSEAPAPVDPAMADAGKSLFLHEFTANDPLCPSGDGLGPVFNARSCAACHKQGGPGGSGGRDANVRMFLAREVICNIVTPNTESSGLIHASATRDEFRETSQGLQSLLFKKHVHVTERKSPALFGANLIDSIPDRDILANERRQQLRFGLAAEAEGNVPLGRAVRLAGDRLGRFGWKGQIASLNDFVQAACANELGLGNPTHAQAISFTRPGYRAPGIDLTEAQCRQITAFISSLPRPVERIDSASSERGSAGRRHFERIGCAECHQPDVGTVEGIYSDLLLHDMGKELTAGGSYADPPLPASADLVAAAARSSEWRTPPLWGVADSAPYLHDGRADTLEAAIAAHGGQAAFSRTRFNELKSDAKEELVAFLKSLRAPSQAK